MAIQDFYTQSFSLYRKTRTTTNGVVGETETLVTTFNGVMANAQTAYQFKGLREEYNFTDLLYSGIIDIHEDDIVVDVTGNKFNVVSVLHSLNNQHHLETLCERTS